MFNDFFIKNFIGYFVLFIITNLFFIFSRDENFKEYIARLTFSIIGLTIMYVIIELLNKK